ncbi:hypothetical protein Cmtc_05410 [Cupriavidus sp. TKC]|nr:hypothetical protein Cmtc_05410 [Cupriavidus sp. TKC]
MPYSVTLDWAMAAPEKRVAAIAASLRAGLYCFFMFKTSVVVMLLRTLACVLEPAGFSLVPCLGGARGIGAAWHVLVSQ